MPFRKGCIPWNKGKKYIQILGEKNPSKRPEVRKKISEALKGRHLSEEVKEKLRKYNLGKKLSEETKIKIGLAGRGRINTIETRQKMSEIRLGIKNYNPIRNERNDPEYKQWVKKVKKRDNNQCVFKGQNCFGYNIVHHILSWSLYPELRYEIKNGITLCRYHHPKKRVDEQRLIPFFQGMVESRELICKS